MGSPVPTSDFRSDYLVVSKCYSTSGRSSQPRVIIWSLQPFARTKQTDAIKLCWPQRKENTVTYWIVQGIHRHLHVSCCIQRENLGIFGRVPILGAPPPQKGPHFPVSVSLQKMGPMGFVSKILYLCGRQSTLNFNHWILGDLHHPHALEYLPTWMALFFGKCRYIPYMEHLGHTWRKFTSIRSYRFYFAYSFSTGVR